MVLWVVTSAVAAEPPCTVFVRAGFVPAGGVLADGTVPWRAFSSIRDAAQSLINPGQVVCVGPGTYVERDISPVRSGIETHPIIFRADPSGQSTQDPAGPVRVLSPGPSGDSSPSGFRILGQSHIIIDGFVLEGFTDPAIQVRSAVGRPGNSSAITIRNNVVRNVLRSGIDVSAEGRITIENNHVEGSLEGSGISVQSCLGAPAFGAPNPELQPRCRGGTSAEVEPVIRGNRVQMNTAHGVFIQDAIDGVIENNEIHDNQGSGIFMRHARGFVIADNNVRNCGDQGLTIRSAVGIPGNSSDLTIRNNRFRRVDSSTGFDIAAEGMVIVEENHVIGSRGSGISVQSCRGAVAHDDPASPLNQRCRGGPGEPVEVIVDSNRIGVHLSHGLFIRDAIGGVVQNNVVFSNGMTGVTLRDAPDFVVFNNLIYRNGEQGLGIGTADMPSPRAIVVNNTIYDNADWGIEIGSGNAELASEGAMVVNNIVNLNAGGQKGIGVINEAGLITRTTCGYVAGFNIGNDEYGPKTPYNVYDVRRNPQFAAAVSGPDGILGGYRLADGTVVDGSADDNFRLRQPGSSNSSPAVDAGYASVDDVGLYGSTAPDGRPDTGVLDAGYHYGVAVGAMPNFPLPFMPVYVRAGGNNANNNNGKTQGGALASIAAGALRARAGVSVVVGPGTYSECQLRPPPDQGRATFLADPSGELTGEAPGHVLLDVGCCTRNPIGNHCVKGLDGFNIPNACNVVIDGFHVRGAADSGIIIQSGSHGAEVRNNVTFSNDRRGIGVVNAHDVRIFNNLVYDNLGGGIQIGGGTCRPGADCSVIGSRRAVIENNTCYGNGVNGILVGSGPGHSTHATVRYNIMHVGRGESLPPGENGIQLGSNTTFANHIEGYTAYFNLNFEGRYGGSTPRPPSDRIDDPLFVNPAGPDGILGGDGFADDRFHLSHRAAGQLVDSPAIDFSDISAEWMGLSERTTRTDLVTDAGLVDLGYHYPLYTPLVVGDCNDDGVVTVSELIKAVRIALGEMSIEQCPKADANGDGVVSISELTMAVRQALYGVR